MVIERRYSPTILLFPPSFKTFFFVLVTKWLDHDVFCNGLSIDEFRYLYIIECRKHLVLKPSSKRCTKIWSQRVLQRKFCSVLSIVNFGSDLDFLDEGSSEWTYRQPSSGVKERRHPSFETRDLCTWEVQWRTRRNVVPSTERSLCHWVLLSPSDFDVIESTGSVSLVCDSKDGIR